ncbi:hypothetical protein F5Y12DRAFT_737166 [Xylaria sp. FL1777]|nr:hypothetical protein F5Y12DRAFT_737166 [Xylaria sp. FL1777]
MAVVPVALILGSGPRIGAFVAQRFASKGYKIAIASRSGTGGKTPEGYLSLKADLAKPDTIPAVFDALKVEFKSPPSVVIYNAAAWTIPPDYDFPLSVPVENMVTDFNINTVSAYVAAQQAVAGWESLPADIKKSFIYTGNVLNVKIIPVPFSINLGIGKSASAYWLGVADATYAVKGYRFYYADERNEDGTTPMDNVDGPAHGEFYELLASHEGNLPWWATFVKGKGYTRFESEI